LILNEISLETPRGTLNIARGPANGPALMLLPGFTNRWQTYLPVLPALTSSWQVFSLDYRGHGRSSRSADGYTAAGFYADAEALLLSLASAEGPAVILGHSMGGSLALHLAQNFPTKVRAVITGDTSLDLAFHINVMNNRRNTKLFGLRRKLAGRPVDELLRRGLPPTQAEETSQLDPHVMDLHAEGRVAEFFGDSPLSTPAEAVRDVDFSRIRCPLLLTQANPAKGGLLQDQELAVLTAHPQFKFLRFDCAHDLELDKGPQSLFFQAALAFLGQLAPL